MPALRCILNVESNLINNMPYEVLFERGIHVVTTGPVFAEPVAELGLAMALNLARGIVDADVDFREGASAGAATATQRRGCSPAPISASSASAISARRCNRLLSGFRAAIRVFDPWLPPSILGDHGVEPASARHRADGKRLRLRRRVGHQRERGLSRRRGLCQHAQGRGLHPAQPRRRRRFRGADGGRRARPHRCGQRRLSRGAAAAGPPGAPPARLPRARPTAPARSTSPSRGWATWCWRTWT